MDGDTDRDGRRTAGQQDGRNGRVDWFLTHHLRANAWQDWNWHSNADEVKGPENRAQ